MRLLMPIDGWFFGIELFRSEQALDNLIELPPSISSKRRATEGLSEQLQGVYDSLRQNTTLREWCLGSKEWKSLCDIGWTECLLLPFASETAGIAGLYLRELAQDCWQNRLVFVEDLDIDPLGNNLEDKAFIGSYVVKLWDLWKGKTTETALNLVCCPGDLFAISLLAAAMDGIPIYCFSETLHKVICVPGWEMPFLYDRERKWLNDLLEGVYQRVGSQSFLSRWLPVVGKEQRTITGEIIRERLQWDVQKIVELPPSPY